MSFKTRTNGTLTAAAATITVNSGSGLPISSGDYYLVLDDEAGVFEVVKVTSRKGFDLYVTRGQAGTAAVSWADDVLIKEYDPEFLLPSTGVTITTDDATETRTITSNTKTQQEILRYVSLRI